LEGAEGPGKIEGTGEKRKQKAESGEQKAGRARRVGISPLAGFHCFRLSAVCLLFSQLA
jgi:hypothetical protein